MDKQGMKLYCERQIENIEFFIPNSKVIKKDLQAECKKYFCTIAKFS